LQGCQVVSSPTIPEAAAELINGEHYDVLLLCHEFGTHDTEILCRVFRRQFPDGRIVAISSFFTNAEALECLSDATVRGDEPDALVRSVMGERAERATVIPFRRRG
jgi:hypothetical protein